MALLTLAFAILAAFALCAYRVAFGPQRQLAAVGLGMGIVAVCFFGLAYPNEQSGWLYAGFATAAISAGVVVLLTVTSVLHWIRTPDAAD